MAIDYITKKRIKYFLVLLSLVIGLIVISILGIFIGAVGIDPITIINIILEKFLGIFGINYESNATKTQEIIVFDVRGPRIIMGILVGAGLAIAGAVMQALFRNPMADSYVLGMSSGAAVGAALAIVFGISFFGFGIVGMAFIFSLLEIFIVYNLSRVGGKIPVGTLLLAGIAMGFFFSALVGILKFVATQEQLQAVVLWLMGSLAASGWHQVSVILPFFVVGFIGLYLLAKELNAMQFGEETAAHLGVEVETVKKILLALSSIMTALAVAYAGIIGFVGLIIPHMMRMLLNSADNHIILPASALFGGIFLVICDMIARALRPPIEIPLGIVTALVGVPYFVYLLRKKKKEIVI